MSKNHEIINSNNIDVFFYIENKRYYADSLQFINVTVNNNVVPIFSVFKNEQEQFLAQHYVVNGTFGFNQNFISILQKLQKSNGVQSKKYLMQFPKIEIIYKNLDTKQIEDKLLLEGITIFTCTDTMVINGSPIQEIYQFYQSDIHFVFDVYADSETQQYVPLYSYSETHIDNIDKTYFSCDVSCITSDSNPHDGDTLYANKKNTDLQNHSVFEENSLKIRLFGVDTPETSENESKKPNEISTQQKKFTKEWIDKNKNSLRVCTISKQHKDIYERYICDLYNFNTKESLQLKLIGEGMSFPHVLSSDDELNSYSYSFLDLQLLKAQQQCENKKGLWTYYDQEPIDYSLIDDTLWGKYVKVFLTNQIFADIKSNNYKSYFDFNIEGKTFFRVSFPTFYINHWAYKPLYNKIINNIKKNGIIFGEILKASDDDNIYYEIIISCKEQCFL